VGRIFFDKASCGFRSIKTEEFKIIAHAILESSPTYIVCVAPFEDALKASESDSAVCGDVLALNASALRVSLKLCDEFGIDPAPAYLLFVVLSKQFERFEYSSTFVTAAFGTPKFRRMYRAWLAGTAGVSPELGAALEAEEMTLKEMMAGREGERKVRNLFVLSKATQDGLAALRDEERSAEVKKKVDEIRAELARIAEAKAARQRRAEMRRERREAHAE
jgi:hypothetical protein